MRYSCSAGSVVVNYALEMMKTNTAAVESVVRDTILENNGRFAGYNVDENSVKASGTPTLYLSPLLLTQEYST